jgi:hypothetical protein
MQTDLTWSARPSAPTWVGGAGIPLDLNPYVTEIAALVTVGMVAVWAAARRRD